MKRSSVDEEDLFLAKDKMRAFHSGTTVGDLAHLVLYRTLYVDLDHRLVGERSVGLIMAEVGVAVLVGGEDRHLRYGYLFAIDGDLNLGEKHRGVVRELLVALGKAKTVDVNQSFVAFALDLEVDGMLASETFHGWHLHVVVTHFFRGIGIHIDHGNLLAVPCAVGIRTVEHHTDACRSLALSRESDEELCAVAILCAGEGRDALGVLGETA